MSNFLEENQKQEIRVKITEDIILYEPNEEQIEEIKNILKELDNGQEGNINVDVPIKYIRYIMRNLCKDGAFVDEYTDDLLISKLSSGNINIELLKNAIGDLLSEINELIMIEQSNTIKIYNQMINILNSNNELEVMKSKFNKLFKKQGYDLKFEDVLNGNISIEELQKKKKIKK